MAPAGQRHEGTYLAALDLGSNSFHLVVARQEASGLHVVGRMREPVRMAAGLDDEGQLSEEVARRALEGLERIADHLRAYPRLKLRAVGTNSFRRAHGAEEFRRKAEAVLGHEIEVLSGAEEARLIYSGVAHLHPGDRRRLVVDIGGGSTELVVGQGESIERAHSLYMGCVSFTERFFPDGKITRKSVRRAIVAAGVELESVAGPLARLGWEEALGASGTIRAVCKVLEAGGRPRRISAPGLLWLEERMVERGSIEALDLPALKADRAAVLPGGVAILRALLDMLPVTEIEPALGALREGVLHDLDDRLHHRDVRERTIERLQRTYSVDKAQAERVEALALSWFDALPESAFADRPGARTTLEWAARVHEIGLAVAYSGSHKHAAYLLEHGDLPGFSDEDQKRLARAVRLHRRKIPKALAPAPSERHFEDLASVVVLLRLAVLWCRARKDLPAPRLRLEAWSGTGANLAWQRLVLLLPEELAEVQALTVAELEEEQHFLESGLGTKLEVEGR